MARVKIVFTVDQIEQIQTMAGVGLSVDQMAAIMGISKKTFERRMADTPEAKDALEKGRAKAAFKVTGQAFKMAMSGKHPAMTMFWLKCRERWKEVQGIEHTGKDGEPLVNNLADLVRSVIEGDDGGKPK
jgi:predicted DNA-binding protein (UPF0251 family)